MADDEHVVFGGVVDTELFASREGEDFCGNGCSIGAGRSSCDTATGDNLAEESQADESKSKLHDWVAHDRELSWSESGGRADENVV